MTDKPSGHRNTTVAKSAYGPASDRAPLPYTAPEARCPHHRFWWTQDTDSGDSKEPLRPNQLCQGPAWCLMTHPDASRRIETIHKVPVLIEALYC